MLKQTLDQRLVSSVSLYMCIIIITSFIYISYYSYYFLELTLDLLFAFVGSILTIGDLNSVNAKLIQAAADWFYLGLALGLNHGTLKDIRDDYHGNKDYLCEMLAARLKTGPPLTYSEICQSLRASTVKQDVLAEAIEKECTGMNSNEAITHSKHYFVRK